MPLPLLFGSTARFTLLKTFLERAGIVIEFENEHGQEDWNQPIADEPARGKHEYEKYTSTELNQMLNNAIQSEDYEKASAIRDEINRRIKE